jgi:hypothetical protein
VRQKRLQTSLLAQMMRRRRREAAAALALVAVGAGVLLMTSGTAAGSPAAAQYEYGHPAPLSAPVITGKAQVGQKLSTSNGTWSSDSPITLYGYRWGRCDTGGNNCVQIAGASAASYTLVAADQGHTIRSFVTATNSTGGTEDQSAPTAVVAAASTTTSGPGSVIAAANVKLPDRLVIDKVAYGQNPIRSRQQPTQMRVHVANSTGASVSGALVYVLGVPYSRVLPMPQVRTDGSGWATVELQPGQFFPRSGYLVLFVRANVDGQDLLGGTSTRRLVQVTIAAPNGT